MTEQEVSVRLTENDERLYACAKRLEAVERRQDALDKLVTAVEVLAVRQESVEGNVKEIRNAVQSITEKPGKRWEALADRVLYLLLGAVFSFTAGMIYRKHKSRRNAFLGALIGCAVMALVSVLINYFLVYPVYAVVYAPMDVILGAYQMILPSADTLLECLTVFNMPFTFCKGLLDVALCFLIYKPLSPLLHK